MTAQNYWAVASTWNTILLAPGSASAVIDAMRLAGVIRAEASRFSARGYLAVWTPSVVAGLCRDTLQLELRQSQLDFVGIPSLHTCTVAALMNPETSPRAFAISAT